MLIGPPLAGQSLNPTVTVLPTASGPVPSDCIDPAARPIQRAQVEPPPPSPRPDPQPEIRLRTEPQPAPAARGDARSELRAAHAAALARDRASYDAALARARARGAGGEALALFDDVTRLWDYQLTAPVGSFFDASSEGGTLLRSLTRHPGFETFIARQTITDANGTRLYPTRESIEFLSARIAERIGAPSRVAAAPAEGPRAVAPSEPARPTVTEKPRASKTRSAPPRTEPRRSEPRRAAASPRKPSPQPALSRTEAKPAPAPAPSSGEEPPMPTGVIATPGTATSSTAAAPTETTAATATETTALQPATDPAVDTATEPPPPARPAQRRSVILPIVLIVIGVGVLILLFRASS
jgi:hypothetical protein